MFLSVICSRVSYKISSTFVYTLFRARPFRIFALFVVKFDVFVSWVLYDGCVKHRNRVLLRYATLHMPSTIENVVIFARASAGVCWKVNTESATIIIVVNGTIYHLPLNTARGGEKKKTDSEFSSNSSYHCQECHFKLEIFSLIAKILWFLCTYLHFVKQIPVFAIDLFTLLAFSRSVGVFIFRNILPMEFIKRGKSLFIISSALYFSQKNCIRKLTYINAGFSSTQIRFGVAPCKTNPNGISLRNWFSRFVNYIYSLCNEFKIINEKANLSRQFFTSRCYSNGKIMMFWRI